MHSLVGQNGHLKLADFGLSKIVTSSHRSRPADASAQGSNDAMDLMKKIMPLKVFRSLPLSLLYSHCKSIDCTIYWLLVTLFICSTCCWLPTADGDGLLRTSAGWPPHVP